ncbi:MAG: glycosyltransferase family 2 protein [Eubacteriales bacterium]|nr:glycosyltransferase family 2 protein [Eubacteriales bacterium]
MDALVSIIVPVYNAEKYLNRCVDSILSQDYPHFELLLMNDGSTDSSGGICDAYAQKDARVRVVHKENTGVSDTRNRALDLARGEYIQFLDSDDWIVPEATRLLVRSMERYQCDMVIADFYRVSGERLAQKGDIEEDKVMTRQEFAACMIENPADFYYGVLWNKLFRREIIEAHNIRMDVSLSWCEDFLFNLEYIRHANSFYALQVPVYYYLKRKGSLATQGVSISNTVRMKTNIFEYYNEFYKDVYDHEDYANIKRQVYSFFWSAAKDGAVLPGSKKLGEERRQILREDVEGDSPIMSLYRFRQLLEYQLGFIAKKNNLSMDETLILCTLYQCGIFKSIRRLSEVTEIGLPRLYLCLQTLERKKLIDTTPDKDAEKKERTKIALGPESERICEDFKLQQEEWDEICLTGFEQKERRFCEGVQKRVYENVIRFMVKENPQEG